MTLHAIDLDAAPKVELHLHLEGAVPLDALWQLAAGRGVTSADELAARFAYRDFAHFIETWVWKNQFLDSYDAFTFAAEAVARELASQNIVYAEAFFSPTDFDRFGLTPELLALAIRRGLDRVQATEVALIVDLVRETGPERAAATFARVQNVAAEARVIGIGIGGFEADHPPGPFAAVYRHAADAGFRLTAHAGEGAGPESVRSAIRDLGVERLGHGVRALEDPTVLDQIVAQQIPLEVCPTSNIRTGVVAGWDEHPVRTLIDAGAMVTINTDDPVMFGCTLAGEYRELVDRFEYGPDVVARLLRNGIDASWAGSDHKRRLHGQLDRFLGATAADDH